MTQLTDVTAAETHNLALAAAAAALHAKTLIALRVDYFNKLSASAAGATAPASGTVVALPTGGQLDVSHHVSFRDWNAQRLPYVDPSIVHSG